MSVLPAFEFHRPRSIEEATELISFDDVPYAGGTELLVAMRMGLLHPTSLIDLKSISGLDRVRVGDEELIIGGTATHRSVATDQSVRRRLPIIPEVLARVGNPRVRATGTLGGNLCFGEPKSDVATLLIALGASVTLISPEGRRNMEVSEFVVGPYSTEREDDEIMAEIRVPLQGRVVAYEKFQTMERPTANVAAARQDDGSVLVVVGAVGGSPEIFADPGAGGSVAGEVEVIPDMSGSEDYKRHIVSVLVDRALRRLEAA